MSAECSKCGADLVYGDNGLECPECVLEEKISNLEAKIVFLERILGALSCVVCLRAGKVELTGLGHEQQEAVRRLEEWRIAKSAGTKKGACK